MLVDFPGHIHLSFDISRKQQPHRFKFHHYFKNNDSCEYCTCDMLCNDAISYGNGELQIILIFKIFEDTNEV